MSHIVATVLPIATPIPRVSVQCEQMGASVGTLVMTRAQWEATWRPLFLSSVHVTIDDPQSTPES